MYNIDEYLNNEEELENNSSSFLQERKEQKITYTISKTKIKDYLNKDVINEETGEVEKINCDWARIKKNVVLQIK